MKRFFFSVGLAIVLLFAYYFVAFVVGPAISGGPPMTTTVGWYAPISLPYRVYRAIMPDTVQMATLSIPGVEPIMFFVANVLLLTLVIFAIAGLTSKQKM